MNRLDLRAWMPRPLRIRGVFFGAIGVVAATFLLLPGAGTYALWNGAATAKAGSVTAGTVSVSESIAQPFDTVFQTGHTATTGAVLVTNTGNVAATLAVSVRLATGSSTALASAITVAWWPVTSVSQCTPTAMVPSGAFTGTLAALAAAAPSTTSLAVGGTQPYCLRESMNPAFASGIASGSAVRLVIGATATAGTVWTSSATVTVSQSFVDDIAPTAVTGLSAQTTATNPVALTWTAATDNVGVTSYDVYRSGTTAAIGSTASTAFTDSGAAAGASYTYTVYARDAVGLTSPAASLFVDRTAPTQPSLTLTGTTSTSATLSFGSTDNVAVTKYTVYRDGTVIATLPATTTSYTDTALPAGVHSYTVKAADAAGNISLPSTSVSATGSYRSGSWYQIVNAASGQCVTSVSPIVDGSALTQSACSSTVNDAQAWLVVTSGSGVTVTSALPTPASNQYLWAGARSAPVTVSASGPATDGSTLWTFTQQADGSFSLSNTITGNGVNGNGNKTTTLCVMAAAAGGGQVTTATCAPGTSQSFFLRAVTP